MARAAERQAMSAGPWSAEPHLLQNGSSTVACRVSNGQIGLVRRTEKSRASGLVTHKAMMPARWCEVVRIVCCVHGHVTVQLGRWLVR